MANIFCRSPFIVTINETSQIETKVEIRIWNSGSAPVSPTYSLSKLIPSTSNRATYYNVSPYIKEYISHISFPNNYNVVGDSLATAQYCNVEIKRYKKLTSSFTLLDTTTYLAFDGWTNYTDGYNYDRGNYLLDEGTYLYEYDSSAILSTDKLKRAGDITLYVTAGYKVKYTELKTGLTQTNTFTQTGVKTFPRVYVNYYDNGCITQVTDASNNVLWESTFKPQIECKYTPMVVDFINKYGAWQREFFFKASKSSTSKENSVYNLLQSTVNNYDVREGQRKAFNTITKESIVINSDWRGDDYAEVIRDILMSERILLNDSPVQLMTKNVELQKHINNKTINYQLEFEYAYDFNNTVI
jgi:hypothetical protein